MNKLNLKRYFKLNESIWLIDVSNFNGHDCDDVYNSLSHCHKLLEVIPNYNDDIRLKLLSKFKCNILYLDKDLGIYTAFNPISLSLLSEIDIKLDIDIINYVLDSILEEILESNIYQLLVNQVKSYPKLTISRNLLCKKVMISDGLILSNLISKLDNICSYFKINNSKLLISKSNNMDNINLFYTRHTKISDNIGHDIIKATDINFNYHYFNKSIEDINKALNFIDKDSFY